MLVFMGTPQFSVSALKALYESSHQICAVYSQPPRPAGRGKQLKISDVNKEALELGLTIQVQFYHPIKFKLKKKILLKFYQKH